MKNNNPATGGFAALRPFWLITVFLFGTAVALRWVRLDLMTFRYDQAEAALRALGAFQGNFPFTGIVNSMGFDNAPGYIWTIIPAFLFSADPRWATAWHGLLASTMIFPLAMLGRRYRSDVILWIPVVLAATLPAAVFGGRNLWSLHLLPAITAWALLALDTALDQAHDWRYRRTAAGAALGILAWGMSIHFSAALLFAIATGLLLAAFKGRLRLLAFALLPGALICVTMIPSASDWWVRSNAPAPKPDFVREFETTIPAPMPWFIRVPNSAVATVSNSSFEAVSGIQNLVSNGAYLAVKLYDMLVLAIVLGSGGWAAFLILKKRDRTMEGSCHRLRDVLLVWILVPAVVAGLFVSRVNGNYLIGCIPAGWLLPLLLPSSTTKINRLAVVGVGALFLSGVVICCVFFTAISKDGLVPGPFYIPYGRQAQVVSHINSQAVAPGHLKHLSGGWFQRPYDYIHRYVLNIPGDSAQKIKAFALIEDKNLWPEKPHKLNYFWDKHPATFNSVGVLTFPSRGSAEIFAAHYFERGR